MRFVAAIAILAFVIALQTAVLPDIRVLGVRPDLLLVVAVTWAAVRGLDEGRVVVFGSAIVYGLLIAEPAGYPLLAMAPIIPLVLLRDAGIVSSKFVMTMLIVAAATLTHELLYTALLTVTEGGVNFLSTAVRVYLPAILINTAMAPLVYLLFVRLSWDLRARRY